MIAEFLRYLTTYAPERTRKFGYLKRLIALEFRARRCETAWAPHQRATRNFITMAADLCERQNIAVVLGSGLLLEVPLKALAERFERVYLVDIFHMPQARREAKRHFNVKLLTGDITGIFQAIKDNRPPGPHTPAPAPRIPHLKEADLIVSCNCMTQLAGPFTEYFEKVRGFSDLDSDKLAYQVMDQHAKALATDATGIGVLITDTERFAMQGDKVVSKHDLLKAFKLPPTATVGYNEEWEWLISPHPEEHATHDYVHTVVGKVYQHGVVAPPEGQGDGLETEAPSPDLSSDTPIDLLGGIVPQR